MAGGSDTARFLYDRKLRPIIQKRSARVQSASGACYAPTGVERSAHSVQRYHSGQKRGLRQNYEALQKDDAPDLRGFALDLHWNRVASWSAEPAGQYRK